MPPRPMISDAGSFTEASGACQLPAAMAACGRIAPDDMAASPRSEIGLANRVWTQVVANFRMSFPFYQLRSNSIEPGATSFQMVVLAAPLRRKLRRC